MLADLLLLFLEYLLEVFLVLFFLPLYELLQLAELLSDELLMYLIGLLDPRLVPLADGQIFIDVLHPPPGLGLELRVLFGDGAERVGDAADIMVLLLLHVAIHALHAHDQRLLLAVEHQWLFVGVAAHLRSLFALATAVVRRTVLLGIVASLAISLALGSLPLCVDVAATLSIRHLPQFALAQLALAFWLFEFLLAEFRALHIDEQQLLIGPVDQVLDVESGGIAAAGWATDAEFGIERRHSFWDFDLLGALHAQFVLADQLDQLPS